MIVRLLEPSETHPAAVVYARSLVDSLDFLRPEQCHTDAEHRAYFADVVVPRCDVWVAERDGAVVGVLAMDADEVDRLYVDTAMHGQGIGRSLLDHAKSLSPAGLHLVTLQRNERACRFYEHHGFAAYEWGTSPAPENEPDVWYRWAAFGAE